MRRQFTHGQEPVVQAGPEEDTLRRVLTGWLAEYGIPVLVVRGFGSRPYVEAVPPAHRPHFHDAGTSKPGPARSPKPTAHRLWGSHLVHMGVDGQRVELPGRGVLAKGIDAMTPAASTKSMRSPR
jgi:hypothetical protein